MVRNRITRTSGVLHMNIVPSALSAIHITAFEAMAPEWLDENFYEIHGLFPAICARMVNNRINPHDYVNLLNDFRNEVCNLGKGGTARACIAGMTIVVWHRDSALRLHYELVMY
jgi:hypothetical protein